MNAQPQPLWTAADAARATGGAATRPWAATGVSINTRTLAPGDLFVALKGPKLDGHDYVAAAFAGGAAAACVSGRPPALSPEKPLLEVTDTAAALAALAAHARARAGGAALIAVTGSVGKTGVKAALAHVLAGAGPTHASEGSLNNQWGLPLSLARMRPEVRFAVLEMGMNHPGELVALSRLARPHVCVITTIQPAHTEFFSSLDAIADAKAEVFAGAEPGWTAVLNRDIAQYDRLFAAARAAGVGRVLAFGEHRAATMRLVACTTGAGPSTVSAEFEGRPLNFTVAIAGRHWVINALGVLAATAAVGGDVEQAAHRLATLTAPAGRGQRFEIALSGGAFTLIDESYNASPASMSAALRVLAAETPTGRRIAVLGDMLEMGDDSARRHRALKAEIEAAGVDVVFLAGAHMAQLKSELSPARVGHYTTDADALARVVGPFIQPGDVVMVKGSAGIKMGRVVEALRALNTPDDRSAT